MEETSHRMDTALHTRNIAIAALLALAFAWAGVVSGSELPWEKPLWAIVNSVTGPVGVGIAFVAIVVAGILLITGRHEMDEFVKRIIYVVMVMAIIIGAWGFMKGMFPQDDNHATIEKYKPEGHVLPAGNYEYALRAAGSSPHAAVSLPL